MIAKNKVFLVVLYFLVAFSCLAGVAIERLDSIIAFFALLLPLALFFYLFFLLSPGQDLFLIGPAILAYYFLFFVLSGSYLLFYRDAKLLIVVKEGAGTPVIIGVGIAMFFFVVGYFLLNGKRKNALATNLQLGQSNDFRIFQLALFFLFLAYLGQILLWVEFGSIEGIRVQYILHQKSFNPSTLEKFGSMLWSTFHPFGIWLSAMAYAENTKNRVRGIFFAIVSVLAIIISIYIFGSRTQLLIIGSGVVLIYHWKIKRISWSKLALVIPFLIALSVWVVGYRTDNVVEWNLEIIFNNLGHSVLDVFIGIYNYPIPKDFVLDYQRWLQLPVSLIPRFIWPDKPIMSITRLDWLIADFFRGRTGQTETGYPASMFAEWYVLGGWPLVMVISFSFGLMVNAVDRWFLSKIHNNNYIFVYIPVFVSLLSYFKDGDIVMSMSSSLKSLTLGILIFVILQRLGKGVSAKRVVCETNSTIQT